LSFVLFLLTFIFYLAGLSGTIPSYRDSGDLIAAIHTLGIAHPPGYVLYVLIGKLFVTLVPFGNVAYRVNVMSAFFAAATAGILSRALRRTVRSWWVCVPVLLFATSPVVVDLARVAEMYTMAAFLAAAILLCLHRESPEGYRWAALLLGLGLSVHPTLIFLAPLFVSAYPRDGVSASGQKVDITPIRRYTLTPILYFCLGLTVFLYLPIRASQHPIVNWGDPSTWRNFWRVVTRADYGGLKLHPEQSSFSWSPGDILAQLTYFVLAMKAEWGWGALGFGCVGLYTGLKHKESRRLAAGLLGSWILAGPAFFLLSNLPLQEPTTPAILQPYLVLVNLLWALFVGMGLGYALSLRGGCKPTKQSFITDCFAALAMTALILLMRPWNFPTQRNDFYAYDYARNLLRSLPANAVLYEPDDPTRFSIQVLQMTEHRRTDVVLLNFFRTRWGYEEIKRRWPDLLPPIPIENGQDLERILWSYSARKRPFFAELPQKLTPIPYRSQGLAYAALVESNASSREQAEALMELYVHRGDFVTSHHPDFFTSHLISYYAAAQNNLGIEYANAGEWDRAVTHYQAALHMEPDQSAARQNLAVALQKIPKLL
jgi:tetratricopeptide (TPR) repeat protein